MTSSKRWPRRRAGAATVLLLLLTTLAYFVSRAAALNEDTIRADIVARLAAWSGSAVELNGPVTLHYFPDFAVITGPVKIADMRRLPQVAGMEAETLRVELGLRSLVLPQAILHRITLNAPKIALRPRPQVIDPAPAPADALPDIPRLAGALRALPVPEIVIVNGEIKRQDEDGGGTFSDVDMFVGVSPAGSLRARGRMTWRGETLAFDMDTHLPDENDDAASMPLTLTLGGTAIEANVESRLTLAEALRATGSLSLKIPDLRRFSRWAGLAVPDGPGLDGFEASGGFRLAQGRLAFDEGAFVLDGNRALGALSLDIGAARPLVSGTLAFSSFDAAPYLAAPALTAPAPADPTQADPTQAAPNSPSNSGPDYGPGGAALLHALDLDLRLSTSVVQTPKLALGQAAVSASVKAGRLTADFAILDLCNGNGNGRIDIDAAATGTALRLRGNFGGIAAQPCLQLAFGQSPMTGNLDISLDTASRGASLPDLLHNLDGRADIESGAGSLALDMSAMAAAAAGGPLEGWQAFTGASTAFTDMRAALVFSQGTVTAETLKMRTAPYSYSGGGVVDTRAGTLDVTIAARLPSGEGTAGGPRGPAAWSARLSGPWLKPTLAASDTNDAVKSPVQPAPAPAPTR